MLSDRWQEVQALLQAALEQPPGARSAWLEREASEDPALLREVCSLLAADRRAGRFLEVPAVGAWLETLTDDGGELVDGARIGAYKVVRSLGRGGMGRVLLAVRADDAFRQKVAIKVADRAATPENLSRFHRERQIQADLDHPNIARLYDGGSTGPGWPYLVMEHIEGEPIDVWADGQGSSVRERLTLFRKVLGAVAYAHRHLIVHLDLKPSNILVTADGEPKLLDFGIAKLLAPPVDGESTLGHRPLTLDYASPEQIRGRRLSTASDIYSLGVVLYRLLTGTLPHRRRGEPATGPPRDRAPLEREPPAPSRVFGGKGPRGRRLRGDLDAIASKALRAEPNARYRSIEAFDEDLDRHLKGLPVLARRGTWRYRSSRFVRRHWPTLSLATALLAATITATVVVSLQARRLAAERDRAAHAHAEAEDVSAFLGDLFARFEPGELESATITVPDVLDRGAAALAQLDERPAVRARLLDTLGGAYRIWGRFDQAQAMLQEAVALRTSVFGPHHPEVASSLNSLGLLHLDRGAYPLAAAKHRQALEILRLRYGDDDLRVADTLAWLGDALIESSELEPAAAFLRRGCAIRQRHLGTGHRDTARCLTSLAKVNTALGDLPTALRQGRESARALEALSGEGHPDLAEALNVLASTHIALREYAAAEGSLRKVLEIRRRVYSGNHLRIAETLNNLAVVLSWMGEDAEAETVSREALEITLSQFGRDSGRVANVYHNLALALRNQGRVQEAELAWRESIDILRRVLPEGHDRCHPLAQLADMLADQGRIGEALPLAREAHALARGALGQDHPRLATFVRVLARCEKAAAASGDPP